MRFFVMNFGGDFLTPLNLSGYATKKEAESSRSWMRQGFPESDWRVVERVGPALFRCIRTGETIESDGVPITESAWSEFLATWRGES